MSGKLMAISDLHIGHRGNREVIESITAESPQDWLIVAGDVGEKLDDIRWTLELLRGRFATVVWVPGNHELWATATVPAHLRGEGRYRHLVQMCRDIDVRTPEDPYPVWRGEGGPVTVAPMFLLYDYTFLPHGARTKAEALRLAETRNAVATDEFLLSHEPYAGREQWCAERVATTARRLDAVDRDVPLVLVNHFPLLREPTRILHPPEFALWCGTTATADWHRVYDVACVVYGHLHLRRTDYLDGVRFEEVSLGYPREWRRRGLPRPLLRQIMPAPAHSAPDAVLGLGRRALEKAWSITRDHVRDFQFPSDSQQPSRESR